MFIWCTTGITAFWKKKTELISCELPQLYKVLKRKIVHKVSAFLLLTTSVRVKNSKTTTRESHHQHQSSVMTTTHSGHDTDRAGTILFVSRGCVQMEVWEVKGCLVFMCACQGLLYSRSKKASHAFNVGLFNNEFRPNWLQARVIEFVII